MTSKFTQNINKSLILILEIAFFDQMKKQQTKQTKKNKKKTKLNKNKTEKLNKNKNHTKCYRHTQ